MSTAALQSMRNTFEEGDKVLVSIRRYGNAPARVLPGTIVETRSTRAVVKFQHTGMCDAVEYKRLQLVSERDRDSKAKVVPQRVQPPPVKVVPNIVPPPVVPMPQPTAAEPPRVIEESMLPLKLDEEERRKKAKADEISAWLDMGRTLIDDMKAQERELSAQAEELAEKARQMTELAAERATEAQRVRVRLRRIEGFAD